jgi:Tfp pilus assembly protein FimV
MDSLTPLLAAGGAGLLLAALWALVNVRSRGNKSGVADPLAEAEVYLAYGQRAKAIDMLQKARVTHPDRADITMKLNELRANA